MSTISHPCARMMYSWTTVEVFSVCFIPKRGTSYLNAHVTCSSEPHPRNLAGAQQPSTPAPATQTRPHSRTRILPSQWHSRGKPPVSRTPAHFCSRCNPRLGPAIDCGTATTATLPSHRASCAARSRRTSASLPSEGARANSASPSGR
jgi:hypothetical protein